MGTRDGGVDRVYLIVPSDVWYDDRLKLEEKVLFGRILYFTLKGDGAYETNGKLGRFLGRNDQTVRSYINRLIECGLVERWYEDDGRRSLIANFDLVDDKGWHQIFTWY